MRPQLILISTNDIDIDLFGRVAFSSGCTFSSTYSVDAVKGLFLTNRDSVVVIESDGKVSLDAAIRASSTYISPRRIFLTSANQTEFRGRLAENIGGYFHRRSNESSVHVYACAISAALKKDQSVFENFSSSTRTIKIGRVSHKQAALQAFRRYLEKVGFSGRLETLVVQSIDELLTNAIFDAPILETGFRPLHSRPRHLEVQLDDHEIIDMKLASHSKYIVVSVTDKYGSFKRIDFLLAVLHGIVKSNKQVESTGLKGIYQAGISMSFHSTPLKTTEITLVIPRVTNYKEFKTGFRFLQVIEDKS